MSQNIKQEKHSETVGSPVFMEREAEHMPRSWT